MAYNVDLRAVQAPLKERYRADSATAQVVTGAQSVASDLSDPRHCAVAPIGFPDVVLRGGLHPAAGGDGVAQAKALGKIGMPVYYPAMIVPGTQYCTGLTGNCNPGDEPASEYTHSYPRRSVLRGESHDHLIGSAARR